MKTNKTKRAAVKAPAIIKVQGKATIKVQEKATIKVPEHWETGAVFDDSTKYRYLLWRQWEKKGPRICFVMLNPSTADAVRNDPTVARCVAWARNWRYGRIDVVNIFAYRSTASRVLATIGDPIGPENDEYIAKAVSLADLTVCAWGNWGSLRDRHHDIHQLLRGNKLLGGNKIVCFGLTKTGQPKHPLYVAASSCPIAYVGDELP